MKIKIYGGLSIQKVDVRKWLPTAVFAPPIERGDLVRDIENGFHIIGIVDGLFYQKRAVSPSEVMDCIRFGMKVFGSSSMGALRAAELDTHGMEGVGRVYSYIKNQDIFEDDFLGQVYLPDEEGSSSIAFIDVILLLADMRAKKTLSQKQYDFALDLIRGTHFSMRTPEIFAEQLRSSKEFSQLAPSHFARLRKCPSTKVKDAKLLVQRIRKYQNELHKFYRAQ